jgi:hypothetical protein
LVDVAQDTIRQGDECRDCSCRPHLDCEYDRYDVRALIGQLKSDQMECTPQKV